MSSLPPTFVSLFAGCGGFDLGFASAGFKSHGAFDIDPTVLGVHRRNLNDPTYLCDLSTGSLPITITKKPDVLLAGSPCQGFSTLGKRRINDPRNLLLLSAGHHAVTLQPKVFVAENVPAVVSGKHKKYWDGLHEILRGAGYRTVDVKCNGNEFGVAQRRSRLFLLAWKSDKQVEVSLPQVPGGVLKDALHGLEGQPNHDVIHLPTDGIHFQIARRIKPDQKLSNVRAGERSVHTWDIPEVFGTTTPFEKAALEAILRWRRQIRVRDFGDADPVPTSLLRKHFGKATIKSLEQKGYLRQIADTHDLVGAFNGKYRRLSWDRPSYTVDTRFGDPKYFLHPSEHRGFTVREAARIQGFPDSFVFHGSAADQYRMVGNAVPPPMARQVAQFVRSVLLG